MLDVVILVPFQGEEDLWLEPVLRRQQGPLRLVTFIARQRLERATGRNLKFGVPDWVRDHCYPPRTAGAVALASSAERAGLRWHAIDPGEMSLLRWRQRLTALRARAPRLVAINTTFITEARWLHLFCALVRRALPASRVALGGYYYATDASAFLCADADIFCVGEGEERLGQIARRVRDNGALDDIPGLFLRTNDGRLRSTGPPPVLNLETLPLPDWSLSARMDPPLDPQRDAMLYNVETQRGCYFKCEFCTYRTLAEHTMMSPRRAAETVLAAGRAGPGRTFFADATGTFPKERWKLVLEAIAAAGGSPHPLAAFARVSDLDDDGCARMADVGVRHLFVGQESGDQAVLNAMRKGTRVSQVRPALDAMARHGLKACFGFISGFPGEDAAAARRTREMMLHLNAGYAEPVVLVAIIDVFAAQDLATVSARSELGSRQHPFGYRDVPMSADQASRERLQHYLALADEPTAPATGFGLTSFVGDISTVFSHGGDWQTGFQWLKAYDRGMALFVRNELEGKPIDELALDGVRSTLAGTVDAGRRARALRTLATRALCREWRHESALGVGILTRLLTARSVWQALAEPGATLGALLSGAAPTALADISEIARAARHEQAETLVDATLRKGKPPRSRPAITAGV